MATVIDSLIVSLGLDSSKFTEGQLKAVDSLKKTEEQSKKTSTSLEKHAKGATSEFSKLKSEMLAVAGLYVSLGAIKGFLENTILQNAALSRMSDSLGMNKQALAEWRLAATRAGGTAESITESIRTANESIVARDVTGMNSPTLGRTYYWAGGTNIDVNKAKTGEDLLKTQADIIQHLYKTKGAPTAGQAAKEMGISGDLLQMFEKGSSGIDAQLAAVSDLAKKQADLADTSEKLRQKFEDIKNRLELFGLKLADKVMPALEKFTDYLTSPDLKNSLDFLEKEIDFAGKVISVFGKVIMFAIDMLSHIIPENSILGKIIAALKDNSTDNGVKLTPSAAARIKVGETSSGSPTSDNGSSIVNKLVMLGWTPAQAAGIAGSLKQESSNFDPNAENPDSHMYGIAQWDTNRRNKFKEVMHKDIHGSSLNDQLQFMNWELNNTHKKAGDKLRKAKTSEEAAQIHSDLYEMASKTGKWAANDEQRIANANSLLNSYYMENSQYYSKFPQTQVPVNNQSTANSTKVDTNINNINIYTHATDAQGISNTIGPAVQRNLNFGLSNANTAFSG